nr:uncharacterized protein LOC109171091 [Ipomoea trifida]
MGQAKAGLEAHMRPPAVGGAGGASGAPGGALVSLGHGAASAPCAGPHRGLAPPSRPVAGPEGRILYSVYGGPDPLKPSLAPSVGTELKPGGPAPGGNGGGDEVLVSVRAEGHPTLPEGRGRGDRAAHQPSAAEPPNGRRQDIIVPRPPRQTYEGDMYREMLAWRERAKVSIARWNEEGSKKARTEGSSKSGGNMTSHPRRGREEGKPNLGNKPHAGPRIPPWAPAPPSGRAPHLIPFTPLRAPPSDILAYAEECHLVRTPDPRPDPSGADMSKYCKYHRCHGHNTNDCQAWRKEIERLLQAGMLGNFIDWDRMAKRDTRGRGATPQMPQTGKEKDRDEPNRPLRGKNLPSPANPLWHAPKHEYGQPDVSRVRLGGSRRSGLGREFPLWPLANRGSWGSYSTDEHLDGPEGRSTLAGLSRAITGGAAREGEKRTPDSTPSKVGSAITPTEDSSSSDCVCEEVGLPRGVMVSPMVVGAIPAQFGSVRVQPLIRRRRERNNELNPSSTEAISGCPGVVAHVHKLFLPILNQGRQRERQRRGYLNLSTPGYEACDEPVSIRGELTRRDVVTREERGSTIFWWSRGTIICTPSPSHSSREFNSGCESFDRTLRGTVGSRLRPWVENGSEVWEEDGGLVVRARVSIIVGMVCMGVKGERVAPKVPKPVLGGEITMGSAGVRERGGMSCGGEVRRDRREAAGGAARAGEDSFGCIACGCGWLRIAGGRAMREGGGLA